MDARFVAVRRGVVRVTESCQRGRLDSCQRTRADRLDLPRYDSRVGCSGRHLQIETRCLTCDAAFLTDRRNFTDPHRRNKGRYCSKRCAGLSKRRTIRKTPRVPQTIEQRFWSKIRKAEGDGCWEWTAARFPKGYGKFAIGSRNIEGAHRMAWLLTSGPIPEGLFVCHRCDNRICCRPNHLFLGTPGDNVRDMLAKGRRLLGRPAISVTGAATVSSDGEPSERI